MKITIQLHKLLDKGKSLYQLPRYFWNKWVLHIVIDRPPVFIVGCGHSGTSILRTMLGAHSRIYAVPFESEIAMQDDPQRFHTTIGAFDRLAVAAGKHRWIEKTPSHIHHVGRILKWCPGAKILLIIRDGRDVACSIQARSGNLEQGIKRWVNDNLAGKEYWEHPNVHVIKYEALISDFEFTIKDVLNFLGEGYEEGMKDYYKTPKKWLARKVVDLPTPLGRNHHKYRDWQIHQPLFDGRGRWKKMSDRELSLVNSIAGGMLVELGYLKEENPAMRQFP